MIAVKINGVERSIDEIDATWIIEQIERRRLDGLPVCVVIRFDSPGVFISFATPTCGGGGGTTREFNREEKRLIELWKEAGLDRTDFSAKCVVKFLKSAVGGAGGKLVA